MEDIEAKVARFAALVEHDQRARLAKLFPNIDLSGAGRALPGGYRAKVTKAAKYTRVDFDNSGKYMVVNATGEIFGIKGYGVIHRGHFYGTLDEIEQWDWSGYTGVKR